jgi:hypothetical protein
MSLLLNVVNAKSESFRRQIRGKFFNLVNHPNFGPPNNGLTDALIGQSTRAVASSLGFGGANGGFNHLYQIGGAHSIQLPLNSVPDMGLHDSKVKNTIRRPKLA